MSDMDQIKLLQARIEELEDLMVDHSKLYIRAMEKLTSIQDILNRP